MQVIELLSMLRITCIIIGDPHDSENCHSQTIDISVSPNCQTNIALQMKTDRENMHDCKRNISDYSDIVEIEWQSKEGGKRSKSS